MLDNGKGISVLSFTQAHAHNMRTHRRNSLVLHIGLDDGCAKKEERESKDENECYIVVVAMT